MPAKTTYLQNALLSHVLRNVVFTSPTTVYVGLLTALTNGAAQTWTEVTGGSYARQSASVFAAPSAGVAATNVDISFPVATANWGTIIAAFIADAVSAGNGLYYGTLSASKVINTNDQFKFLSGSLSVQEQ
jgi:hypothetical protein